MEAAGAWSKSSVERKTGWPPVSCRCSTSCCRATPSLNWITSCGDTSGGGGGGASAAGGGAAAVGGGGAVVGTCAGCEPSACSVGRAVTASLERGFGPKPKSPSHFPRGCCAAGFVGVGCGALPDCFAAGSLAGAACAAAAAFVRAPPAAACCASAAAAATISASFSLTIANSIESPSPRFSSSAACAATARSCSLPPWAGVYSRNGVPAPPTARSRLSSSTVCIAAPTVERLVASNVLPLIASIVEDLPTPPAPRTCRYAR
jgi:hypothetical protein